MYAAIGSYMVRVYRLFDLRFVKYPPRWLTAVLALLIYVNFFSHHYIAVSERINLRACRAQE